MKRACLLVSCSGFALWAGCFSAPHTFLPVETGGSSGSASAGSGGSGGVVGGSGGSAGVDAGGSNGGGQLPVCDVETPEPCARVERILAGGFTCAVLDDQTVRCFGENDSGQLGDASLPSASFGRGTVSGVSASAQFSLGQKHACAIDGGRLKCWGRNRVGQLGTGNLSFSPTPVFNLLQGPVSRVSTLYGATCAVEAGGVWCWGHGLTGQSVSLLDGGIRVVVPLPVQGIDDVVDVGVGLEHACAVKEDSSVWCWGLGADGRLGNDASDSSQTPVRVGSTLSTPVHQLSVGSSHTCVLAGDPAVIECWGSRIPVWDTPTDTPTALKVQPSGKVVDLQSGYEFACVLLQDGRVQCWGSSRNGRLGTGGPETEVPTSVVGISDAVQLAVGTGHACALRESGEVLCWGGGFFGQLGEAGGPDAVTPITITWQ